jgi:hypothetical protein
MQNSAMLSSAAAQSSLDAVLKLGDGTKVASPVAVQASVDASQANAIWANAYKTAQDAVQETQNVETKLSKLDQMVRKGVHAYSNAITSVSVAAPTFPA